MNRRAGSFMVLFLVAGVFLFLHGCASETGSSYSVTIIPHSSAITSPVSASAVAGDGTVTLSWQSVSRAMSYNIYMAEESGVTRSTVVSLTGGTSVQSASSPYTRTGLTNNTTYYFVVTAVSGTLETSESPEVSATPVPGTAATVSISGKVQYEDKEYNENGFTGTQPYKAVRYATVEVVESASAAVLKSDVTDSTGSYLVSLPSSTTLSVYIRVKAEATPGGASRIEVKNLASQPAIYSVASNNFTPSGMANIHIAIPASLIGGAFNILDVFTNGFEFVNSMAGLYPPALSAYWPNHYSTYYCDSVDYICRYGEGIYIFNDSYDTDEYDDDVMYHEFGHYTAANFSKDDSQGGFHRLSSNDLDLRMSWSEGWGDFFPGAVKTWLQNTNPGLLSSTYISPTGLPSTYVDTAGSSVGIVFDMGNPDAGIPPEKETPYIYAANEVAIANILVNIEKTFGMQPVWDVISDFKADPPTTPVNLEAFWDRWESLGKPLSSGGITVESLFRNRRIVYADLFTNDSFATATIQTVGTSSPEHTLYPDGNADYIKFTASQGQQCTIKTIDLWNGADTYIELYSSSSQSVPMDFNDNTNGRTYSGTGVPSDYYSYLCDPDVCSDNGYDILGSQITFTAPSAGTYYVKIYSSPTRPVSAGRYGTFKVSISSP